MKAFVQLLLIQAIEQKVKFLLLVLNEMNSYRFVPMAV